MSTEHNNIFRNIDCMEGMKEYPDKHFDLAIVDPPYGIKVNKNKPFGKVGGAKICKTYKMFDDNKPPDREYFQQLFRVSINQIIFGANHFISKIPHDSPCWIVWDKDNSGIFADCELAWTSFNSAVRKFVFRWNGMLQEHMGERKEERIHPTQKPVALYKWILHNYAKPGDKILDTHVGSASSLIACEHMGFEYVGFELDTDYYNAAKKRLLESRMQTRLEL